MLTLAHFNPTVTFPKLKGEYIAVIASENFKIERVVTDGTVYFLGSLNGRGIAGGCINNNSDSYPDVFKEDNMRCGYTTVSRLLSYVMAMVHDVTERLAYLDELLELTKRLNALPDYEEPRVAARLVSSVAEIKATPHAPMSNNETVVMASEIWHIHPTFNDKLANGKYEDLNLEIMALWGIEKVRYIIGLERGDYKLGTFVDVGFEENPVDIVNAKLAEFNIIQEFVPVPPVSEESDEEV